jgi:hypothetical protein
MAHEEAAARLADFEGTRNAQAALVEEYKAQDKELDKGFKRDFADAKRMADAAPSPEIFDALKKLFNRRKVLNVPKGTKAAAKAGPAAAKPKAAAAAPAGSRANAAMLVAVQSGASVSSDAAAAGERSGVSYPRDPYSKLDAPETEQMVEALDAAVDMPEGISFDLWDRLVEARDTKIEAEEQLKVSTATLGRMNEFYALLSGELAALRADTAVQRPRVAAAVLASGVIAFLLNVCNFLVTQYTSAVTLQVLGNVKVVLSIGTSLLIFGNTLAPVSAVGCLVARVGRWARAPPTRLGLQGAVCR